MCLSVFITSAWQFLKYYPEEDVVVETRWQVHVLIKNFLLSRTPQRASDIYSVLPRLPHTILLVFWLVCSRFPLRTIAL